MAKVIRDAEIELSDYFNRFGFGDGDDAVAKGAGYDWREEAIGILNGIMAAKGLKWVAEEEDISSIHNTLYIKIKDEKGTDINLESDYSGDSSRPSEINALFEGDDKNWFIFKEKVWPNAFKEFEKIVSEGEAKREGS